MAAPRTRLPEPRVALERLETAPLFGRATPLAAADLALERAASGMGGRAFLLQGEPGIGKTRCTSAIAERARALGFQVLEARCHEMDGAPALWPWAELLRALGELHGTRELRRLVRPDVELIARILPEARGSAHRDSIPVEDEAPHQLFDAIARTLTRASKRAPLLILIDDLHWGEPASVELARFAARELCDAPIVFWFLQRSGELPPGSPLAKAFDQLTRDAETFVLEGLTSSEVGQLVAHVHDEAADPAFARALCDRTGGNPLFVREILRILAMDPVPAGGRGFRAALPPTIRHTLQRRLDVLSQASQRGLRQAAVLGTEFAAGILGRACDAQGLDALKTLDEATRSGIVLAAEGRPGWYRFAHDLLRETALAGAAQSELAQLHRQAADAIVAHGSGNLEPHYAQLSHHYLATGDIDTARLAANFAAEAGSAASNSFAFEAATEMFSAALRALDLLESAGSGSRQDSDLRCEVCIGFGHALWEIGRREEARERYTQAAVLARELGNPVLFARAAIGMGGRNDLPMDFPDTSAELIEEALSLLPREDSRLRVRLVSSLVRASYYAGALEGLIARARDAVRMAERVGDPGALFIALEALHYALLVPACLEERLQISTRLAELAARQGAPRPRAIAALWRTVDLLEACDSTGADAALSRFERAGADLRQPYYRWLPVAIRATRAQMQGRLDEAEKLIFEAQRLGQEAETPNALIVFGTQLFHLREEQGRLDELLPLMERIVAERPALPVFRIGVPLIHALAGRIEEARASFESVAACDFEDVPRDQHRIPMLSSAGVVAAIVGDERRARLLLEELRPLAGHVILAGVATHWGGATDFVLGCLAETIRNLDAAIRFFDAAVTIARRAGARLHEAHALSGLARALGRRGLEGDDQRAVSAEGRAQAIYAACGASWRLGARMRAAETSSRRAAARDAVNAFLRVRNRWLLRFAGVSIELPASKGLTYLHRLVAARERELDVLDLVAAGIGEPEARALAEPRLSIRRGEAGLELADARALRAYRARLLEIDLAIDAARRDRDLGRSETLAAERDAIERELSSALGVGGRGRRSAGSVERARKAAYNRIRGSIARITNEHPALGKHLDRSVRTGTTCSYRPEHDPGWQLE